MDPALQESFVNRPHWVLGCRLRPFSLAHRFALIVLDSPFLYQYRKIEWRDLEMAVAVTRCKRPLDDLYRLSARRSTWGRILRLFAPGLLKTQALAFQTYVSDYSAPPETAVARGGRKAKAPWVLRIIETLKRSGFTEEEAWSMPEGQALWRYATIQELDGNEINILDEEERDLLNLAAEAEEE